MNPRDLDESAGRVEPGGVLAVAAEAQVLGRGVRAAVLADADDHVGTQRAVSSLLTAVVREQPPATIGLIGGGVTVVERTFAGKRATGDVRGSKVLLEADVATDLRADIGAGDVVETSAIQGAELHVFARFGLDGKIGSLCP